MNSTRRDFLKVGFAGAACVAFGASRAESADPVLGMIFPPANYPVPPEATFLYPSGVRFLAEGVGLERMTPEAYEKVIDRIVPSAVKLKKNGATAISIMGTSLTFYKGAAFNQQLIDSVKQATGLPATSMSTAIVNGLREVGGRRIAVATAYTDEVNRRLRTFLEESGFEVLTVKGMGIERFADAPPVTQDGILKFSVGVHETAPKADAMLVSCGALRTLEILAPMEQQTKVPVVSSNPHALWDAVRLVGLRHKVPGYGTLLARG